MATNIFNYDGTLLTTVQDGTLDSTHASIKFPGRGYLNYGEPVNENMLWMLQNFANASAPAHPVTGQLWYDTSVQLLKFYNGSSWLGAGGAVLSPTNPGPGNNVGAFWYDTTNNQLYVWSSTSQWLLVGPLGSSANADPVNPAISTYSKLQAAKISDGSTNHQVWYVIIGGVLLGIFSKDATFVPVPAITGFTSIQPGLNLNNTITGIGVSGDATLFHTTQTNLPSVDNTYDLGSSSYKFSSIYATNFVGTATQALYADLAEKYLADRPYAAGTVVKLGGRAEITVSNTKGDSDVFGVVSTNPAYLMNSKPTDTEMNVAVALTGRVPCKVVGPVKKGQRLMLSDLEGSACAWEESYGYLAILGRSLVEKTSTGIESIEIVLGKN
jgi:hypothetical protein